MVNMNFDSQVTIAKSLSNELRLCVINLLFEKKNNTKSNRIEKYSMSSRQITKGLKEKYNIKAYNQLLKPHLNALMEAGMIVRINRHKGNTTYFYSIKDNAEDDLMIEHLLSLNAKNKLIKLFDLDDESVAKNTCKISVVNGKNQNEEVSVPEGEELSVGKQSPGRPNHLPKKTLIVSESYESVSSIYKPHIKIYHKKGSWFLIDENSSNGTFVDNAEVKNGEEFRLKNKSFIKLSSGLNQLVLFFRYS